MDPPTTPRRLGARNLNQKQKEPAHVSSPKPAVDIFSRSLPPPLHGRTKSGEPTEDTFGALGTSPKKTGNSQLADMFDNTLRLAPSSSPAKPQPTPTKRLVNNPNEDNQPTEISMLRMDEKVGLRRRNNKENARPILTKENTTSTLPAISENGTAPTMRKKYDPLRNLTVEEREKLAKPQVKRLANVAQLCMSMSAPQSIAGP